MEKVVLILLLVAAVVPGFANDSLVAIPEADSLPGFGSLRISPILQSGVGAEDELRIEIDGKPENGMEFSLLSGNHSVVIRHRCYETAYFDVDMSKDGVRELNIPLRAVQGALDLRSIENDEPKSAPVFVNDFKVGETPLVEIVPICSKVTIGENRNAVPVTLKKNEVVRHTYNLGGSDLFSSIEIHDSDSESGSTNASTSNVGADVDGVVDLVDERDGQVYKTVKVGDRVWMAQNLNYNVAGSYCYENESSNCERFGRLYEWSAAIDACPAGWRLPSLHDMEVLLSDAGGYNIGGLALKSKGMSGSDSLGFAALPAGVYQDGEFDFDGSRAYFWSSKSRNSNYACGLRLNRGDEDAAVQCDSKNSGFSVRCLKVSDEGSVDVSSSSVAVGNGSSSSRNGSATTLKDPRDGQVYKIAKIGYQTWMTQNLNYKTTGSYCFDNSSANCKKLGRLYEWNAAVNACPDGWRLPTKEDFERLVAGAGGTSSAGTLLKSRKGWSLDGNGKDSLGFSALPAGDCDEGKFYDFGKFANFWSATEYRSGSAYLLNLASNSTEAKVGTFGKKNGFSIRCLENNGEDSVFTIMDLDNYKAVVGGGVGTLEDSRDGQAYKTVQIGGQIWMAQNLSYPAEGSYCSELSDYDCQKYGRLYQWKSAMAACPSGWRLPTREDFERLLYLVGGKTSAGKMLKSSREWIFNGNGRGAYGFDVYPAGSVANGSYGNEGSEAFFWSSSEDDDNFAFSLGVFSYTDYAFQNSSWKNDGLSVRCISNSSEATR